MTTINAVDTSLSGQTGTGNFVGANTPTLITPVLGAATATSVNFGGSTLSNYVSETSWTPVFTFGTPGDLSVSYATQTGIYTRIGSIVFYKFSLVCTPTFTTSSGNLKITGLPVTVLTTLANCPNIASLECGFTFPAGTTSPLFIPGPNTTVLTLYGQGSATNLIAFAATSVATGVQITFDGSGFYFV